MNLATKCAVLFRAAVNSAFPIALFFSMTRLRCTQNTKWIIYGFLTCFSSLINTFLFFSVGQEVMMRVFVFIVLIPSIIVLIIYSEDRLSQILFNFFTAVNALYLVSILGHFMSGSNDDLIFLNALFRAFLFSVIIFIFHRSLNEPYHFLAANMEKGWGIIAAVPILFFVLVMFLGLFPHTRSDNLPAVVFLYIILGIVYFIIYQVFSNTFFLLCQQRDNEILKSQVRALSAQAQTMKRSQEQIRIYRHDMRHYLKNISALIQAEKYQEALDFTGKTESQISQPAEPYFCVNPTINAVLSLYLTQAQEEGICVKTNCDIPLSLPADAAELSTVFANAIENACNACRKLPENKMKIIEVRCISSPQFILEISNTFDGNIEFDYSHRPETNREGHGIGTRSLAAFAEKYHAILDYKTDGDMFFFRLLINRPPGNEKAVWK